MAEEKNVSGNSTLSAIIDDVNSGIAALISRNESAPDHPTVPSFWYPGYQNSSDRWIQDEAEDETDLPVLLSVRLAIIVGVIVSITILGWGSYTIHRKRVRDSKKQKHHETLLL